VGPLLKKGGKGVLIYSSLGLRLVPLLNKPRRVSALVTG